MKPVRIQRKRTKNWKMPPNTIYVGRPSVWGNPYQVGDQWFNVFTEKIGIHSIDDVIGCFEFWLKGKLEIDSKFLTALKGKNLACWCPLSSPCHADILLEYANRTF